MGQGKKVLIVIITANDGRWLGPCLESLQGSRYRDFEVAVILNDCQDDSARLCSASNLALRVLPTSRRMGFAEANNLALAEAGERGYLYIFLLNADTWIHPGAIGALIDCLETCPDYGILGSWQARYGDETWSEPNEWSRETLGEARDLGNQPRRRGRFTILDHYYVQGAALMMRAGLIARIGMLDPFYGSFYEETDFCRRALLAGWKIGLLFDSKVQHWGGGNWRRSRRAREERDQLFLHNQLYYQLSALELKHPVAAAWKIVGRQVGDLFAGRRHYVLPLWRYPRVLFSILRNRRFLFELKARNLSIREGKPLDPSQRAIGRTRT